MGCSVPTVFFEYTNINKYREGQNPECIIWNLQRPRGGLGGRSPQKFEVGDSPCIGPPNILRSSVVADVRESMNRVKNGVFLVRKWSYTTFNIVNIRKMWEKKGKIPKTKSMTKKKVIRNFYPENGNINPENGNFL